MINILMFFFSMFTVLLILTINVSGGRDNTLTNQKQVHGDKIKDTTEQTKFLLETSKKPDDKFFTIEDDIRITKPVALQSGGTKGTESTQTTQKSPLAVRLPIEHQALQSDKTKSTESWRLSTLEPPLAVRLFIKHQAKNRINEGQAVTKKFSTSLEARKAHVALHGRSVSEAKCVEYESLHCRCTRMAEYSKELDIHVWQLTHKPQLRFDSSSLLLGVSETVQSD
ncbi:uncharacterized protein [Epargyreus clarus]|uniref:uncharacterized protein isoform X2 n=1 Tax=Epargyreus clarus TaxID=520877 RepID=UPI003C2D97BE